jgi:hypothetical protein
MGMVTCATSAMVYTFFHCEVGDIESDAVSCLIIKDIISHIILPYKVELTNSLKTHYGIDITAIDCLL